jgi:Ca2+-binding RTX toxin-like protein
MVSVGAVTETLVSIERLIAGRFDDDLTGDAGTNVLTGGDGDDRLVGLEGNDALNGGPGDDLLDGGEGSDLIVYPNATSDLRVDLDMGVAYAEHGQDELVDIERVTAGAGNDELLGSDGRNVFSGGPGDDRIDGRDGDDRVLYLDAPADVDADLAAGTAQVMDETDTLIAIEELVGSSYDDRLAGDAADNVLEGRGGADRLIGGGGSDRLDGGPGDDELVGGAGADRFVFRDDPEDKLGGRDALQDFVPGTDLVDLTGVEGLADFGDLLAASGADGADTVIDLDSGSALRLVGVAPGALDATDFLF